MTSIFKFSKIKKIFLNNINQKGFTLIELLLYIGILAIFISILGGVFGSTVDLQLESGANVSVDRDKQYILTRLAYDIHRAAAISTPASDGISGNTLVLSIGGNNYTYNLDGNGNLVVTNNVGSYNLNSFDTKLSNLTFTKIGNLGGTKDTVQISFTITSLTTERKGTETRTFQTTIGLR